jgi:hypothetical protein
MDSSHWPPTFPRTFVPTGSEVDLQRQVGRTILPPAGEKDNLAGPRGQQRRYYPVFIPGDDPDKKKVGFDLQQNIHRLGNVLRDRNMTGLVDLFQQNRSFIRRFQVLIYNTTKRCIQNG